ncbi:LPXTG cell wall anchor domain-containing protein [Micromonospora sp. DR5-3]|uniref:LPXTG cell wall anchor domain-containing protein n=1 Tax=unclassified Micromonospora TaxID=2617518 RepID=UPI0011DB3280|nr:MULTISPECIES: LPXTG cell wall anchor domain-containing protein [unclassified Micromonospora]MCW3813665.1 LPXTG cell wall anchor domain-containing protein [Micromonospora sp. DR5-3]TYC25636.1 LPXTG cell wall anchor domain-containing protein [Micromonospora sp. MP36]
MLSNSTRRWLAGLGVAGAFVAASATPAAAAEAPFEIVTHDLLVAPGHMDYGWFFAHSTDSESKPKFGRTTVDIDLSKVADFATVEPSWGWTCDVSPTKLHCEADLLDGEEPWFDYMVTGKDNAKPGQQGDLAISITSGGKTATATAGITIAEGVDLVSDETVEASGAPGTRAGVPGVVRNAGDTTVDGTVLVVQADWLASYGGDFSNCKSDEFGMYAFCTFDTKIEPGKSYQLSENLPIKLRPETRTGAKFPIWLDWWTTDDWNQAFKDWPQDDIKPGSGGELRLVEQTPRAARVPQTDLDKLNNMTLAMVRVTGNNPADLEAKGATAKGKKGDVVTVRPSFTNLGPAVLEYQGQGTPGIELEDLPVRISIPEGTTAVEAPFDCVPYAPGKEWDPWNAGWGEPGAKEYACQVTESPKDMNNPYEFGLRIDKVLPDATGTITTKLAGDPNTQNNTAKIVVNPTGAGTPGDGGQGGGGQGGGDGGSLPITGSSTALIAGVGALLLVAGLGGYVVARRRKTRFVA